MRNQPKSKIPKMQVSAYAHKKIREAVERDSIRWQCSKSWIIATALAAFYDIDILAFDKADKKKHGKNQKQGSAFAFRRTA
jgi:hypothetical protein